MQLVRRRTGLITNVGRLEGFPVSSSGRYSAIALVTTRARRYSATPLLSTAWSLCSNRLMTDSGLKNVKKKIANDIFLPCIKKKCYKKKKKRPCLELSLNIHWFWPYPTSQQRRNLVDFLICRNIYPYIIYMCVCVFMHLYAYIYIYMGWVQVTLRDLVLLNYISSICLLYMLNLTLILYHLLSSLKLIG